MKNENLKTMHQDAAELLKLNPHALQFLHHADGFNFEAPFKVRRIHGRFTAKSATVGVPAGHFVAGLMFTGRTWGTRPEMIYVRFRCGEMDARRARGVDYYKYGADYFFSKGDFEEKRKSGAADLWIVAQDPHHNIPEKPRNVDYSARFKLAERPFSYSGDGRGNSWISSAELRRTDSAGEKITIATGGTWSKRAPFAPRTTEPGGVIDKSGYLLFERRREHARRADELRNERRRAAAAEADFSAEESAVQKQIDAAREYIAAEVLKLRTYDDVQKETFSLLAFNRALRLWKWYNESRTVGAWKSVEDRREKLERIRAEAVEAMTK